MKITKTMRYEISYDKELYNLLSDIQYVVRRIKNKAVSMAWDWQQFSFGYNERFGEYPKPKNVLGKGLSSDIYGNVKDMASFVASSTVDTSVQEAVKKFEQDKKEILRGEKAIQEYKRGTSFPIRSTQIKNLTKVKAKEYSAKLSLLSKDGAKERGIKTQVPVILKTGGSAKVILDRIIDGSYKMCDSRIGKAKNKFYLLLAYSFEKEADNSLDESKVVGIDLGVVNAAYLATNFDEHERLVIEGGEISEVRRRVEGRRKSMLRQSKYCGEGRKGHGRKTLLKPTDKLRHKVENFRKTTNHKYSKAIIDFAVKNGCGVIQMEDLSGISSRDKFLANWSYYELQQFVEYKAKEEGIKVKYIDPKYTSQRCSCCGHIAKGNRDITKSQSHFKCAKCGYKTNADFNAAKNIAEPRIETLIQDEFRRQEHEKVTLLAD